MGKPPTVWMRALRFHTYQGRPHDEGDVYQAHEDMVETIEQVLKFAVRDIPPPQLTRGTRPLPEPEE